MISAYRERVARNSTAHCEAELADAAREGRGEMLARIGMAQRLSSAKP
jgi:hypothetical protein